MKTTQYRKIVQLGKVALYGKRKINQAELTVEIREAEATGYTTTTGETKTGSYLELSISGGFWNNPHTDYVCCGQCTEEIRKHFRGSKAVRELCTIWDKWHLNGMNAGTEKQSAEIEKAKIDGRLPRYDYTTACEILKEAGLYDENGYLYGHGWLVRELPQEVIERVKELVEKLSLSK